MKWIVLIVFSLVTSLAFSHPRDSVKMVERKKAKIERKHYRMTHKWDERTIQQKRTDRRAIFFLAVSAGVIATSMAYKNE